MVVKELILSFDISLSLRSSRLRGEKSLLSANLWLTALLTRMSNMRKYLKALSLVFVLVLVSSPIYAQQKTTVTRIIDGDVIQALYGGVEKRIRLIGIDAPESRIDRKALKDANMNEHDIEAIIKAGYANVKSILPNVKYKDRFLNAFKYAEETERGLWDE